MYWVSNDWGVCTYPKDVSPLGCWRSCSRCCGQSCAASHDVCACASCTAWAAGDLIGAHAGGSCVSSISAALNPPRLQWPEVQNPIRITHFGYHVQSPAPNPWFKKSWDCFDVHKDVVAAPHDATFLPPLGYQWPSLRQLLRGKTRLMMYSGWIENRTRVTWQTARSWLAPMHAFIAVFAVGMGWLRRLAVLCCAVLYQRLQWILLAECTANRQPYLNPLPFCHAEWAASCLLQFWRTAGAEQALQQRYRPSCGGDRPSECRIPGGVQNKCLLPQPRWYACAGTCLVPGDASEGVCPPACPPVSRALVGSRLAEACPPALSTTPTPARRLRLGYPPGYGGGARLHSRQPAGGWAGLPAGQQVVRLPAACACLPSRRLLHGCRASNAGGQPHRLAHIPVCPQDGVYQPYEDLLPYHAFSLRFSLADVPTLVAQLQQVPPRQVVAMYKALRRWHRAFLWPRELGGRAYEYTVASLHARLHRLWGVI